MEQYDTNKDGKIAGAELDASPALKSALKEINPSGNSIDADQIAARIKAWQDSKVGRTSVTTTVLRRGKPLAGATLTLEPEKFLGENMLVCTAVTDEYGQASPSAPMKDANDAPGVPPGFYLVRITKAGENIPDRYNTKTTLGVEAASDSANSESGLRLDLAY
jgi:hypothetical protein